MVGITSYGVYIPYYRLNRAEVTRFWGGWPQAGERAVANYDEDCLTMAVEACRECLVSRNPGEIDRFYLSSTTFPYGEKQSASLVAQAVDLQPRAWTVDIAGSLRSGTSAVRLALDAIQSGSARSVLTCSSDVRLGAPGGPREMEFGDGAAAFLLGEGNVVASFDWAYSVNDEIYDVFRPSGETYVRSWEDRFVREMGYARVVEQTVAAALREHDLTAADFSRAVFSAPNAGYLSGVARSLGFNLKTQVQDGLFGVVGNTGTAQPLMLLAAALDQASPGDRILWVSYGDGCDVLAFTVTEGIAALKARQVVDKYLQSKNSALSYPRYLRWRQLIDTEPPARPRNEPPSAPALLRDRKCGLALYGVKCKQCGTVQYPAQRVCMECQARDEGEYYPFADKQGTVTTFSHDNLAVCPDPPSTVAAVDFDGGGRMMLDITDRDPSQVTVGMKVEMTFRRLRQVDGITVYWWKCRPLR